jgi:uncharacterized protein YndB with AHSA1/START domain
MSSERVIIEREVFIAAIPETVFGFLTDPAFMAQWIGLSHTPDPRPDGVFRLEFPWGRDGGVRQPHVWRVCRVARRPVFTPKTSPAEKISQFPGSDNQASLMRPSAFHRLPAS